MAVYKVPQDVEAEDKLIGPFSLRQFIYLVIVAISIALAWFLGQIFVALAIIPLPFVFLFGALALPLRKDQPMEIYLAALLKFYLKPKQRMWQPEGQFSHVTITVPKTVDQSLTKEYGADEAGQRLSYLSQIIDTQGWSTRGVSSPTSLNPDITAEAASTEDVFDETEGIGRSFSSLIEEQEDIRKKQAIEQFQQGIQSPVVQFSQSLPTPQALANEPLIPKTAQQYVVPPAGSALPANPAADDLDSVSLQFNPYPNMHQHVIQPQGSPTSQPVASSPADPATANTSGAMTTSPDIMRLANNNDLSISALAREAHRSEDKGGSDEIVVPLR